MVTDAQVLLLRRKLSEDKTQETAAAAAGMSVRTARKWKSGLLPSESRKPRHWRTRPDPFADVWGADLVPLLETDARAELQATTLLEVLEEKYPSRFGSGHLRTLQRRVRDWRAVHGPDKEVYFPQQHVPGREGAVDFTHATSLGVTINGEPLVHLLFEFVLSYSGWTWTDIAFGETYEALVAGVQGAVWELGGVPQVIRLDNLSAATHELRKTGGRTLTKRFAAVLEHYGLESSRIRPGQSHENGVAEQSHRRVKSALAQALIIRGHSDFADLDAYRNFIKEVVERSRNRRAESRLAKERRVLRPLPSSPVPSHTIFHPTVRRWSTIRVGKRTYSVPSRLIGHRVKVRQHADTLEVFYGEQLIETLPRLRGDGEHRIDYRHIIWSLVRKPGAFTRYRYREELFPSLTFRRTYDALQRFRGERADVEYVRILHLAASTLESLVEKSLAQLLASGKPFDYAAVRCLAKPEKPAIPEVAIPRPDLRVYDRLLVEVQP